MSTEFPQSAPSPQTPPTPAARRRTPSIAVGLSLLSVAAVLIVVVLVNPAMPQWLRVTIAILAVAVVVALLGYSAVLVRSTKPGRQR